MKKKLKISALLVVAALLVLVVSTFQSSIAYFSDKSTGWTETYRLPNTSYQVSIGYEDGSQIKDLNNGDTVQYVVKINNTGNIPMVFSCTYSNLGTTEEITVRADTVETITKSFTASTDINSLEKILNVQIKPIKMLDDNNSGFEFSTGEPVTLILYAK